VRLIAAILFSALSVVPAMWILTALPGSVRSWFFGTELLIALIISSVGVLLVGLPCHIVLQARGLYSWWRYALAGFLAPALLVIVFLLFVEDKWGVVRFALGTGGFGALVGSVFWGIAVFPQARASRLTSSCSGP